MVRSSYQKGSIRRRKRKHGIVYELRYRIKNGTNADGSTKWLERTEELRNDKGQLCSTDKEAERARDKRMRGINPLNSNNRSITVAEFVSTRWQQYIAKKRIKESTAYSYENWTNCNVLPMLGDKLGSQVSPADITDLLAEGERKGWEPTYTLTIYSLLKVMFGVAEEYGMIDANPVRAKLHRPVFERREKPALTGEEIARVISSAVEWARPMLFTLSVTGVRIGENLAFKWSDIDFSSRLVRISHTLWRGRLLKPKTKASRQALHMPDELAVVLQDHYARSLYRGADDFVFCRADGRPHNADNLRLIVLYPAMKKAGIERQKGCYGWHIFRHSAATIVDAETRDRRLAQELLRHTNIVTTSRYTHDEGTAAEATELLARRISANCGQSVVETTTTVH